MAKQSAIGANLYLGVYDLSGDVGAVTGISSPRQTLEVTSLNKSAPERLLGKRDGAIGFSSFWNTGTGQMFDALSSLPSTDLLATVTIPTATSFAVGDVGCAMNGKQTTLDPTRGADGSLVTTTQLVSTGSGLEWGRLLTAGKATVATGTVNQDGIDDDASTDFGGAAYLHVFSIASGTMGVKLQESDDDSTYTDVTGGAFTNVTAATSQRIVLAHDATIKQYVRLATTGTHGDAVLAVLFVRYASDQAT